MKRSESFKAFGVKDRAETVLAGNEDAARRDDVLSSRETDDETNVDNEDQGDEHSNGRVRGSKDTPSVPVSSPPHIDDDGFHGEAASDRGTVADRSTGADDIEVGRNIVVDAESTTRGTPDGIGPVEDTVLAPAVTVPAPATPTCQDIPTTRVVAVSCRTGFADSMEVHCIYSHGGDPVCELDPFPEEPDVLV